MTSSSQDLEKILSELQANNKNIFNVLEFFELNENIALFRAILKNIKQETYRELFIEYLSTLLTFNETLEKTSFVLTHETEKINTSIQSSYDFTTLSESKNTFVEEISKIYPLLKNKLLYSYIVTVYGRLLKYNLTPKSLEALYTLFSKLELLITNRKNIVTQLLVYDEEIKALFRDHLNDLLTKNYAKQILAGISKTIRITAHLSDTISLDVVHSLSYFKQEKASKETLVLAKQFTDDVLQKFFKDEYFEQNVSLTLNSSKYRDLKKILSAALVNRSKDELMSNHNSAEALIYRLLISNKNSIS